LGFGGVLGLLPTFIYTLFVLLSAASAKGLKLGSRLALLLVLPIMHLSWGSGFLSGLLFRR
jgi:hypothetical protein